MHLPDLSEATSFEIMAAITPRAAGRNNDDGSRSSAHQSIFKSISSSNMLKSRFSDEANVGKLPKKSRSKEEDSGMGRERSQRHRLFVLEGSTGCMFEICPASVADK